MGKKICSLDTGVSVYKKTSNHFDYYICMNSNNISEYKIYVGFPFENLDNFIEEDIAYFITEVYNKINQNNDCNIVYLLPSIDMNLYKEATSDNDEKLYIDLFSNIYNMTTNAYKYLRKTDDVKINQIITIIRQNDMDDKFCMWLELNPNVSRYVDSIKINTNQIKKDLKFLIKDRIEKERLEQERLERERLEREMLEKNKELEEIQRMNSSKNIDDELIEEVGEIDDNLENTIIVDPISVEYMNIKPKYCDKRRLLIKPTVNQYGFSNMYSIILGLVFSVFTGLMLGLILLK